MYIFFFFFLTSLAKWLSVRLRTKWLWVRIPLQSLICTYVYANIYLTMSYYMFSERFKFGEYLARFSV